METTSALQGSSGGFKTHRLAVAGVHLLQSRLDAFDDPPNRTGVFFPLLAFEDDARVAYNAHGVPTSQEDVS